MTSEILDKSLSYSILTKQRPKSKLRFRFKPSKVQLDQLDEIPSVFIQNKLVNISNPKLKELYNQYLFRLRVASAMMAISDVIVASLMTYDYFEYTVNHYALTTSNYFVRSTCVILSLLSIGLIILRNYYERIMASIKVLINYQNDYYVSHSIASTIAEIVAHSLVNFPYQDSLLFISLYGKNYLFTISVVMFVLSFLRLYSIFNFLQAFSFFRRLEPSRLFYLITSRDCMNTFIIKSTLKRYGLQMLIIFCVILLIIFSVFLTVAEELFDYSQDLNNEASVHYDEFRDDLTSLMNSLWFISETITAIGYGDYFVHTLLSQLDCIVSCILGNIILSFLTVYLMLNLDHTATEARAYSEILSNLDMEGNTKSKNSYAEQFIIDKLRKRNANLLTTLKIKHEREVKHKDHYLKFMRRNKKHDEFALLSDFHQSIVEKSNEILDILYFSKEKSCKNQVSS